MQWWPAGVPLFKISPWQESKSCEERELYRDVLEMKVIQLALKTFLPMILGESVSLMSDANTVVAYVKKRGSTVSRVMYSLAQEVVAWTELHLVTLSVRYVLGKNIILTDQMSCPDQVLPTEWLLLPWVFDAICEAFSCTCMDLFPVRANSNLPLYVFLVLDAMA